MANFAILTNNTKGLRDELKRNKIFSHYKSLVKSGIIMFQETHSIEEDLETWTNELGMKTFLNHGSSASRGTLMAVTKDLQDNIGKYFDDKNGRLQFLTLNINDEKFLFINIYNANTEIDQIEVLNKLNENLSNIENILEYNIVCAGDWNFYKDISLDTYGGNPKLKIKSIALLAKIAETYDLCDIYRVRNPRGKKFTFRQSGQPRVLRRLDYIMISNALQERIESIDILASVSSDHSPVFMKITGNSTHLC